MKVSRALILKLICCAGLGLLISVPGVYAAGVGDVINNDGVITEAETTAIVDEYNDEAEGKNLEELTELGEQFIADAEAAGGGEATTEAIMTAVLDAAIAAGAAPNQIDVIEARLVAASGLSNASSIGGRARGASSGALNPTASGQSSAAGGGDPPVSTNTSAGSNTIPIPAGCSPGNLQCIADGNGLTVAQVQARLNGGAILVPSS